MGFIKEFVGGITDSIGGTLADQWQDYYAPKANVPATAAVFQAVPKIVNNKRGQNGKGNTNIITNGSKILVPEGMALITMQDGAITGIIAEAGGYTFTSNNINSSSVFEGHDVISSFVKSSFEKFKFGGQLSTEQLAFYINLKEIPNNKFGTQSEIYWDDAYLGTQVGALARGTYTLKIIDPIIFIKNFVPVKYLQANSPVFDFADMSNDAGEQLFNEVITSLSSAFAYYTNDPNKGNRISRIQQDQVGFAKALAQAVERDYGWKSERGLEIVKTAIIGIEYDKDTQELMKEVKKADAFMGARGNARMQQKIADGLSKGNGNGANMMFMGMEINSAGNIMNQVQQMNTQSSYNPNFNQQQQQGYNQQQGNQNYNQGYQQQWNNQQNNINYNQQGYQQQAVQENTNQEDPVEKLLKMKKLLDAGAISQEEYDLVKSKILGV